MNASQAMTGLQSKIDQTREKFKNDPKTQNSVFKLVPRNYIEQKGGEKTIVDFCDFSQFSKSAW